MPLGQDQLTVKCETVRHQRFINVFARTALALSAEAIYRYEETASANNKGASQRHVHTEKFLGSSSNWECFVVNFAR